jgi:hypothetical protein
MAMMKSKVVHVPAMKAYRRTRSVALFICNLGTEWGWVVNITPLLLYPQGKNSQCSFGRRLQWPQRWSGHFGEQTDLLTLLGVEPQSVQFIV